MAAVTTGVVAAGSAAYGANRQRSAAEAAARGQQRAADASLAQTQQQYEQTRRDLRPYREGGGLAFGEQQALLGLQGQEAQQAAYDRFVESPAVQFLREQGMRGLNTRFGARGIGGGQQMRELQRFGTGLAAQSFGDYYNRLSGLGQTGYGAAAGGAQLGAQNVANQAGLRQGAAQARASGILGAEEARTRGIRGGLQALPYITEGLGGMFAGGPNIPPPSRDASGITDPNLYAGVA